MRCGEVVSTNEFSSKYTLEIENIRRKLILTYNLKKNIRNNQKNRKFN